MKLPAELEEHHVLDARELQQLEADRRLIDAALADQFQVDPVLVGGVVLYVSPADDSVVVGDKEASGGEGGVVGEVGSGEHAGGGVPRTSSVNGGR